LFSGFASK
jgi:tetratricopeptide (TPR) repeat protein